MDTLLLDTKSWDLVTDAFGNIALASNPYAIAQDVASALRLFINELYYDTAKGMRYFEDILGWQPPLGLIKDPLTRGAMTVPEVVAAQAFISVDKDRVMVGQVQCQTSSSGVVTVTGPVGGIGKFTIAVSEIGKGVIG